MFLIFFNLLGKSFLYRFLFIIFLKIFSSFLDVIGLLLLLDYSKFIFSQNNIKTDLFLSKILPNQIFLYNNLFVTFSLFILFFFIIKFFFQILTNSIKDKFIEKFTYNISANLFNEYLSKSYNFFLEINTSQLITNLTTEIKKLKEYCSSILEFFQQLFFIAGVTFLIIFFESKDIIFVLIFFIILSFTFYFFFRKFLSSVGKFLINIENYNLRYLNQIFNSMNQIKILSLEVFFTNIFNSLSAQNYKSIRKRDFIFNLPKIFFELLLVFFILLICSILFYFSENSIQRNIYTLTLLILSSIRLFPSFNSLATSIMQMKANSETIKNIFHQFNYKKNFNHRYNELKNNSIISKYNFKKPFLELKKVSFKYPDSNNFVLKNLDIVIKKGQIIGVIGKSGLGKTTFVNLILGLLAPTNGKIISYGVNIVKNIKGWRSQIGYIPQEIFLLDDTIRNNIAFGFQEEDIDESLIRKLLILLKLSNPSHKKNIKSDYIIGEGGKRISGGQKQRIAIARALYRNPSFLIFDEATNSLDEKTENDILNMIYKIRDNKTIIFVTHKTSMLKYCDYILEFKEGNIYQYKKNYLK
jgi:ABC-type multidrug transport system fused ATPase/permease subunit